MSFRRLRVDVHGPFSRQRPVARVKRVRSIWRAPLNFESCQSCASWPDGRSAGVCVTGTANAKVVVASAKLVRSNFVISTLYMARSGEAGQARPAGASERGDGGLSGGQLEQRRRAGQPGGRVYGRRRHRHRHTTATSTNANSPADLRAMVSVESRQFARV
jgi:hypothetical protein